VAEVTGFDADSLRPEMRLLDDLNLDSLRAGEVVAKLAARVGAAVDPSALANASLSELERALVASRPAVGADPQGPGAGGPARAPKDGGGPPGIRARLYRAVADATGFAEDSLGPGLRLLDDLNLDSLRAGELIARLAAGGGAGIDPSALANASLAELEAALRPADLSVGPHLPPGAAPPPAPSPELPGRPADGPPAAAPAPAGPPVLLLVGADDAEAFDRLLGEADALLAAGLGPAAVARWLRGRAAPGPALRGAVLGRTAAELSAGLRQLRGGKGPARPGPAADLWFGCGQTPARLAFVFPGQGAQRPGMAAAALEGCPGARSLVDRLDAWLGERGREPVGPALRRPGSEADGALAAERLQRTELTQVAVCAASLAWLRALDRVGLRPDVVAGHSLGELTALHAAGALGADEVLRLAAARGAACATPSPRGPGAMAGLRCGADEARALLQGIDEYVVVANLNAPTQVVVSGTVAGVDAALRRAATQGVAGRRLPVSAGFHSEMVEAGLPALRAAIDPAWALPGTGGPCAVSSVTGGPLQAGLRLCDHLPQQLMAPVDWVGAAQALADRAELIIEVGPGATLSRLIEAAVPGGPACVAIEPTPGGVDGWLRVLGAAFAAGHPLQLGPADAELGAPLAVGAPAAPAPDAGDAGASAEVQVWTPLLVPRSAPLPDRDLGAARVLLLHRPEEGPVAEALEARLRAHGAQVQRLDPGDAGPGDHTDLVLIVPDEADARRAVDAGVRALAAAAAALPRGPAARGAAWVQLGGGDFGLHTRAWSLATAHAASVHLERPELRVRVLDLPRELPAAAAGDALVDELRAAGSWVAAGVDAGGRRRERRSSPVRPEAAPPRPAPLHRGDLLLVTGGARGITAVCALALARASGARLVLAGRSPAGHPEVQATLTEAAAAGISARYLSLDVTDAAAVRAGLAEVCAELGPITAVLHGAGLNRAARVDRVPPAQARADLSPKVDGLLAVLDALRAAPPRWLVAFTSVIGVAGMAGNAWYAYSNEVTDLIVRRFAEDHPGACALGLAWGLWSDVGMGAQEATQRALRRLGLADRAISPGLGVARLFDVLARDLRDPTAAISFDLSALGPWQTPAADLPLVDRCARWSPGERVQVHHAASVARHPWLRDHEVRGEAVWPAVMTVELMAEAAALLLGWTADRPVERIEGEGLSLLRPVVIDGETDLRVDAAVEAPGAPGAAEAPRVHLRLFAGDEPRPAAELRLRLRFGAGAPPPGRPAVPEGAPLAVDVGEDLYGSGVLFHGPAFQRLGPVWTLEPEEAGYGLRASASPYLLGDPFARDAALQGCALLLLPRTALPASAARFVIEVGALGGGAGMRAARATRVRADDQVLVADLELSPVQALGAGGPAVERWAGACFRLREALPGAPAHAQLADPDARLRWRLHRALDRAELGPRPPGVELRAVRCPGIHDLPRPARHALEEPLLVEAAAAVLGRPPEAVRFGAGGPRLEPPGAGLSVSHTDDTLVVVAAPGAVGCDLCPLDAPGVGWEALLGPGRADLWRAMRGPCGDGLAGAALWAAVEAARKIDPAVQVDLQLLWAGPSGARLRGQLPGQAVDLWAARVELDGGRPHVFAVATPSAARPGVAPAHRCRFPITMRDQAGLGGLLRCATFHAWMGKARELAISPILPQIHEALGGGTLGMVTNATELRYLRPTRGGAELVCELHLVAVGELDTVDLLFDWLEERPGGQRVRVAISRMTTSWVRVLDHGLVQAVAAPPFFSAFLREMPQGGAPPMPPPAEGGPGPVLARAPRRAGRPADFELPVHTGAEDGNLVGNVYFDRYALWASRAVDAWLHQVDPSLVSGPTRQGDWVGSLCRISHLREAMPFDAVVVGLQVRTAHAQGFGLELDVRRVDPDGRRVKLATGELEATWVDAQGRPGLPPALQAAVDRAVRGQVAPPGGSAAAPWTPAPTG
jgi:acyl transferase domain-containing protein/acyl-CoA thioesterase FadM/acyl carrier protein